MKWGYIILFLSFCLIFCGVSSFSGRKKVPLYEINPCVVPLIKGIVDNCNSDTSLNKFPYGYLFFSKKKEEKFSIIIKPIETSFFPDTTFYGAFELLGRKFYCIGDVLPKSLINKTVSDFVEIEYKHVPTVQNDSIAIALFMDRFSDLNTKHVAVNVAIEKQLFSFYFQPCNNLRKKQLKKIRDKNYCKD